MVVLDFVWELLGGAMQSMTLSHLGPCWEHVGGTCVGMLTSSRSQVAEQIRAALRSGGPKDEVASSVFLNLGKGGCGFGLLQDV